MPELQIDLDFSDGQGFVAIAVTSTPLLIDAKAEGIAPELTEAAEALGFRGVLMKDDYHPALEEIDQLTR